MNENIERPEDRRMARREFLRRSSRALAAGGAVHAMRNPILRKLGRYGFGDDRSGLLRAIARALWRVW